MLGGDVRNKYYGVLRLTVDGELYDHEWRLRRMITKVVYVNRYGLLMENGEVLPFDVHFPMYHSIYAGNTTGLYGDLHRRAVEMEVPSSECRKTSFRRLSSERRRALEDELHQKESKTKIFVPLIEGALAGPTKFRLLSRTYLTYW